MYCTYVVWIFGVSQGLKTFQFLCYSQPDFAFRAFMYYDIRKIFDLHCDDNMQQKRLNMFKNVSPKLHLFYYKKCLTVYCQK